MGIPLTNETSLLDIPSGTVLEVQVRKPHKASVQVVLVAPNGHYKVLMEWPLYVDDLIARNAAGESLPNEPRGHTIYSRAEWEAKLAAGGN